MRRYTSIPASLFAAVAILAASFPGCSDSGTVGSGTNPQTPIIDRPAGTESGATPAAPVQAAPREAQPIMIQVVDKAGYDAVIRKHEGQVVLVDFWATWCIPCKKMFPHTVHLHDEFAAKGLAVVSVSLDDEAEEPQALEFLQKQKATFDNLRVKSGGEDETFEQFEIRSGAIPHLKLYDRTGKIHRVFDVDPTADKQFTSDDVEQAVRELLR
jgi:thiol-disulfide isomerase/thioredoxin